MTQEERSAGGVARTIIVLDRGLMLSRCRNAKSQPRIRCMGKLSTTSQGTRNFNELISRWPEYWPRTFMPPALPPTK
jgi:hypothetical protein